MTWTSSGRSNWTKKHKTDKAPVHPGLFISTARAITTMRRIEDEIRQRKFTSMQQKAMLNLIYTSNWLQNKQQSFFKAFGITGQQFNILRILKGQHPKSISGTEIKDRMLDRNSHISPLLVGLAAKDLITKRTCPNDKRASDVMISEKGLALLREISKTEKPDEALALSDDEAAQLSELLDKARNAPDWP